MVQLHSPYPEEKKKKNPPLQKPEPETTTKINPHCPIQQPHLRLMNNFKMK